MSEAVQIPECDYCAKPMIRDGVKKIWLCVSCNRKIPFEVKQSRRRENGHAAELESGPLATGYMLTFGHDDAPPSEAQIVQERTDARSIDFPAPAPAPVVTDVFGRTSWKVQAETELRALLTKIHERGRELTKLKEAAEETHRALAAVGHANLPSIPWASAAPVSGKAPGANHGQRGDVTGRGYTCQVCGREFTHRTQYRMVGAYRVCRIHP